MTAAPETARRRILRVALKTLSLAVALGFVAVFLHGWLSPPGERSGTTIDFGGLAPGQAGLFGWNGEPVWVVHRSPAQLAQLAAGEAVAPVDPSLPADWNRTTRSRLPEFGIYLARTASLGVLLQYLSERPRQLPSQLPWGGGFVNPQTGALFDAAGRPYPPAPAPAAELPVPPHRYIAREMISLGSW